MLKKSIKSCVTVLIAVQLLPAVQAQERVLEEIVVTAQRREQSIQEVPVSLEAYSGAVLNQEGFRAMEDLSNFSPSTEINVRTQDQTITIRGMGTTTVNPGLESAVPIFVDGVHFGRFPMIMGAFLDLERVEVLRGPQPVAFGQNATAGAFSLTTRKPSQEWQGDLTAEYGNFGRASVEGGIGGPITDTLGIRVAGQWDKLGGVVRDIVTDSMFPNSEETGARVTLQWTPTEDFQATLKGEYGHRDRKGDGNVMCRTRHPVAQNERAVTVPGLTSFDDIITVAPIPADCDEGFRRVGIREGGTITFKPVPDIYQEDARTGFVDLSEVVKLDSVTPVHEALDNSTAYTYQLTLDYDFANGINLTSNTAYVGFKRKTFFDNSSSPILSNWLTKGEIFDMFSQEIRFLSPRGGAFEWEAGAYYQQEDLDASDPFRGEYYAITLRANIRRPIRVTYNWQDARWVSAYGAFTFNFLGDKASIDLGGRYTTVTKDAHIEGFSRTWIFDINPIDPLTGRANSTHLDGTVRNVASRMIDCATGHFQCGSYGAGYWTHEWRTNDVPDAWHTRSPVDAGPYFAGTQDNDAIFHLEDHKDSHFDPQVTLRYRPTETVSLYGKWARAFKSGGLEISAGTLPGSEEEFILLPEYAETFEAGAKGMLLDGRAMYNISLFTISIKDLQIETNVPTELGGGRGVTNAGKQRTRGVEFDLVWAATDRLTAGVSGALMDGVMVSFPGAGCTDFEFETADTGPCLTAEESEELFDTDDFEGTIDRSGYDAPRTPDYKIVLDLDYWHPVFDRYKVTLASRTAFSDDWIFNVQDFEELIKYDKRVVSNLTLGFGDLDDTWKLNFWARNLLGRSQGVKYFPEFDPERPFDPFDQSGQYGVIDTDASPRDYTTYGVQFTYNYN